MEQKCTPKELIDKINELTKENGYGHIVNIATECNGYVYSFTEFNNKAKF